MFKSAQTNRKLSWPKTTCKSPPQCGWLIFCRFQTREFVFILAFVKQTWPRSMMGNVQKSNSCIVTDCKPKQPTQGGSTRFYVDQILCNNICFICSYTYQFKGVPNPKPSETLAKI